jgi:LmbE family N-acetylglucosaminyl deacetylase
MVTTPLRLDVSDRLLVVLPHPDDESLAAAGLLQHALTAGAAVRLAFATEGDNNPWAQRATERRLLIRARERARFGALRRTEALAALRALGVPADATGFLGFPDQGLTRLLMTAEPRLHEALRAELVTFRPTILVSSSRHDRHPDHNALAVLLELCLATLPGSGPRHLRFFIHSPARRGDLDPGVAIALDGEALRRKQMAIECHRSQQFWRGGWLRSFARPEERFLTEESVSLERSHPVAEASFPPAGTTIRLASTAHFRAFGPRTLLLAGLKPTGEALRLSIPLRARLGPAPVLDGKTGAVLGGARIAGNSRHGTLCLDPGLLPPDAVVFAKVEHHFGFFDEAGWRRLS